MSPTITSMISSAASLLATPIMEQMKYLFNLRANMRKLKKAVDDLEVTKKEVEEKIKSATEARDDEVPTERVHKWLDEVQTAVSKVSKIESDHNQLKMCFGGCSLNCWAGYKISKLAVKALEEVSDLEKEREEKMDVVTEKVVPARRPMPDSTLPLLATEILLGNAIEYLKDETVGVIGIWGMGGVGKTTLLKRINNHPEVESAGYNFVIWVVVSQEFNPYQLQRDIAKRVGLSLEEQDSTTELQAERLRHFLKDRKFLLLLDDIWQAFDLEKLGIPSLGSSDNIVPHSCKVVFTTRFEKVCDQMAAFLRQVRHKKIKVEYLKPEEAWELFIANTGETVQSIIKSDIRVHARAQTVANKCAGLPLALVVIARAMSGNKTWREWEEAVNSINDLRLPELLVEGSDPLYPVLKVSYDRLMNDHMRKCFLCCALWPEDFDIPKDDLMRCWLGMGLIADFSSMIDAVNKGHSIIESLKGAAMLEETTDKDFEICVKLHDIIRGMALWIASDCGKKRNKWIVRTGVEINRAATEAEEEKWREAEIISLMHSKIGSLQQFPNCPNLNALLLRNTHAQDNLDVDGLIQTPALTYVDLSDIRKMSDRYYFKSSLVASVSNLVGLQCLDLSGHKLKSLPKELVNLSKLKYLFIRDGFIESMPHGLISGLQKLEILDLSNTRYDRWEENGEASLAELGSINAAGGLKGVGIRLVPHVLQRLSSSSSNHPHVPPLWHLQIAEYDVASGAGLKVFRWKVVRRFKSREDVLRFKTLGLRKSLFPGGIFPRSLQSLELSSFREMEEMLIAGGKEDQFHNLEVLKFRYLEKLEKISWEGGVVPHVLFQNLSSLTFALCFKLKDVSWIAHLPYLEILSIAHCPEMKQLIVIRGAAAAEDDDDGEEAAQEQDGIEEAAAAQNNVPVKILPNLKFLYLQYLYNLRSFCSPQITLPSLQRVQIRACEQLNRSFLNGTNAKVTSI